MSSSHIGKNIGKYRVVELIGRGGMAEVYKAYQSGLERHVAVKLMHTFLADDKEFGARFQREARVVASMRHPNVVQVHDFDFEDGMPYMVMEYIDGEALKDRLARLQEENQWITLDEAVRITLSVGSALKYAHRLGMVHRDVKPANVMINREGQVILTDFGIAKILSGAGGSQLTASGAMVGTPSYMSPEQGMGQPGDERSDIYSLGVMLYQLATGRLPYEADTPLAVVIKHVSEPLPMPRSIAPDLPEEVERVIVRALAKDPAERYQNVGDMMTDLRRAMNMPLDETPADLSRTRAVPAGAVTTRPATTPLPGARSEVAALEPTSVVAPRQRPKGLIVLAAVLAGVLLVAAIGGVYLMSRGARQPTPSPVANAPSPTFTATSEPSPFATSKPSTVKVTVHTEGASLYTDPGGSELGGVPEGTVWTALARTADNQWIKIQASDGTGGWMQTAALDLGVFSMEDIPQQVVLIKPSITPDLTATQEACKPIAKFLQDVSVPEGTRLKAGEKFTKTWRIENTGNCPFDVGTTLVHKLGERMGGPESGVDLPAIKPGETADISVGLITPQLGGAYSGVWELLRAKGQSIGELSVSIVSVGPTATPVSTRRPTATPAPAPPPTQPAAPPPGGGEIGPFDPPGPLEAVWGGGFYDCVVTEQEDTEGNTYAVWEANFFIEVHGGTAGYRVSSPACRYAGGIKFVCRLGARMDGQVLQNITFSCPNCTPVQVIIQASAERKGPQCVPK